MPVVKRQGERKQDDELRGLQYPYRSAPELTTIQTITAIITTAIATAAAARRKLCPPSSGPISGAPTGPAIGVPERSARFFAFTVGRYNRAPD